MTLPTFSPDINPSFPYGENPTIPTDDVPMHKGYMQSRPIGLTPLRRPALTWKSVPESTRDYILSFFRQFNGSKGPFWWTPINKVDSPNGIAPTTSQFSGGSLSERTYYFVFTWYDSANGETLQSDTASITVAANYYARVTVPPFPTQVEGWRLYGSETEGSETLQATITTSRTWSQSGALGSSSSPPSSNTLSVPVKWMLASEIQSKKITANRWSMSVEFEEYII